MSKKVTKERLEAILPGWEVEQRGDESFEIYTHSPAGEQVVMSLQGKNLGEMATNSESYYDNFDPADHAAVIYHKKWYGTEDEKRLYAGALGDIDELLEDARIIDNWYYEVGRALREAWEAEEDDVQD